MTNEEILQIQGPSRELDAMAAFEVMGADADGVDDWVLREGAKPYSSSISDAFQLQKRIEELGLWHPFISWLWKLTTNMWDCANASALDRTKAAILARRGSDG